MHICVGTLQNIYINMKDSGHFDKCNFPFLLSEKIKDLICSCSLVCRYISPYVHLCGYMVSFLYSVNLPIPTN